MENKTNIIKDSYQELVEKTTWPKWNDLQSNTVTVAGSSVLIALVIAAIDKIFNMSMESFFQLF
jgi:preprotein translocase subunit SecE